MTEQEADAKRPPTRAGNGDTRRGEAEMAVETYTYDEIKRMQQRGGRSFWHADALTALEGDSEAIAVEVNTETGEILATIVDESVNA